MTNQQIRNSQGLLEGMLCYNAWLSKESYDVGKFATGTSKLCHLLYQAGKTMPENNNLSGMKLAKFRSSTDA
jgi:hypothetical protein